MPGFAAGMNQAERGRAVGGMQAVLFAGDSDDFRTDDFDSFSELRGSYCMLPAVMTE
jgi:hypothetical protein